MRPLAIIGNVNVDIIVGDCPPVLRPGTESLVPHGDVRPAGCVGNTALAWMAMGIPFQAAANTGQDVLGDWLRAVFQAHSARWPSEPCATTVSVGISHPDSERTFLTTIGHVAKLDLERVERCLDLDALRGGIALVVGSFLTDRLTAQYDSLFDLLAGHRIEIALDTGWPVGGWTADVRARCRSWLARCRHLLMNEAELMGLFDAPTAEAALRRAAAAMPAGAVALAKRGPLGASAVDRERMVHVPAPSVRVIDTAGAGDIFNAGFLAALAEGKSLRKAVARGVVIASRAISTQPRDYSPPADDRSGASAP